ncbi:hypothetical protein SESBI_37613 [Sesbania bispinosa]|nr:hypothetical protein SESBI_37613 [Sesbania bispinosa]
MDMSNVASPPSSMMRLGPPKNPQSSALLVHHQYSLRVSLVQEKTVALSQAIAAVTWSCVEKMFARAPTHLNPRDRATVDARANEYEKFALQVGAKQTQVLIRSKCASNDTLFLVLSK